MTKTDIVKELHAMRKYYDDGTMCSIDESICGKKIIDICIDMVMKLDDTPKKNRGFDFGMR